MLQVANRDCPLLPRLTDYEGYIKQVFPKPPDIFDTYITHWINIDSFKLYCSYRETTGYDCRGQARVSEGELAAYRKYLLPNWLRGHPFFFFNNAYQWVSPRHLIAYLKYVYPLQSEEEREAGGVEIGPDPIYIPRWLDSYIVMVHNHSYDHDKATEADEEENRYALTRSTRQRFFLPKWKVSRPLIIPMETKDANGETNFVRDLCTFPNFWSSLSLYLDGTTTRKTRRKYDRPPRQTFFQYYSTVQMAYVVPSDSHFARVNMVYLCRAASEAEFYDSYLSQALVLQDPPYPVECQDPTVYKRHQLVVGIFASIEAKEREKRRLASGLRGLGDCVFRC